MHSANVLTMSAYSSSPPISPPSSDSEDDESCNTPSPLSRPYVKQPSPHPLAASTKANRDPPSYSKRYSSSQVFPINKTIFPLVSPVTRRLNQRNHRRTEQNVWEAAIAKAIDKVELKVDLSFLNLTYIPSLISDLGDLVILPQKVLFPTVSEPPRKFIKSSTAPILSGLLKRSSDALLPPIDITEAPKRRPFARAGTVAPSQFPFITEHKLSPSHDDNGLQLYLMGNRITSLPRELFELDSLVVLSLRGNSLTSLPPAIRSLRALRELNIANNRIRYLPAEIQELQLHSLHLWPNPYLRPPNVDRDPSGRRVLGLLERRHIVPSLKELVLRSLLTPHGRSTAIEETLSLADIDALSIPWHIQPIIQASTGHSRSRPGQTDDSTDLDVRLNNCPSPRHQHSVSSGKVKGVRFQVESKDAVFSTPLEVRMEWVTKVAGVAVADLTPIQWRGCGHGCLSFLESEPFGSVLGEEGEEFEFSDQE